MKPNAAKPPHGSLAASVPSGEGREDDSLPEGLAPEIDPARFARAGERLAGSTSVARMPRLMASGLLDEGTLVHWQLQATGQQAWHPRNRGAARQPFAGTSKAGRVDLGCQPLGQGIGLRAFTGRNRSGK